MAISSSSAGGPFVSPKMGVNTMQNPPQTKLPKKKFMPKMKSEKPVRRTKKQVQKQQQKRWK